MAELELICLFVDFALWEEPPLQVRTALHFAARELRSSTYRRRRQSSQPMETGKVRSVLGKTDRWNHIGTYEASVRLTRGATQVSAGRRKKNKDHQAP